MNKAHLAFDDISVRSLRQFSTTVHEVDWPVSESAPVPHLIQLYNEIETAMQDVGVVIVQFVSITPGMGGEIIAMDMAWAASTVLGRDILLVNGTGTCGDMNSALPGTADGSLPSLERHLMKVDGYGLYVVDLNEVSGNKRSFAVAGEIVAALRKLAPMFDMIIVAAPPSEIEPFAPAFARHVDGNVLVVEAERTHRSCALQMRQILERSGRPLLGSVLNNRNTHLPSWLSRLLGTA